MAQTDEALLEHEISRAGAVTSAFHGRPVEWVRDVTEQYVFRPVHALLGELRCVWVLSGGRYVPIRFKASRPHLGVTADATSLYVLGGDQDVSLLALGLAPESAKDRLVFGPLARIEYFTYKNFHNFEPVIYSHDFGSVEDGNRALMEPWQVALLDRQGRGPVPVLGYDFLNQRFAIEGGAYTVRPEGIVF